MTPLFIARCAHPVLNNAEVFFADEQYQFKKQGRTVIALQRTDDAWQVATGDAQLKEEAEKMLDQYLMSQH